MIEDLITEDEIIKQVLLKLDGWELATEENIEYEDFDVNKIISSEEILDFYTDAMDYALSYTQQPSFDNIIVGVTPVIFWTAGLIWNKYNIRTNNQLDDTNILGYGDKLIIQAKEMLKPYKLYNFHAF